MIIKGFLKIKLDEDIICTFCESDNVKFTENRCDKKHLQLHESKQYAFKLDNIVEYYAM